MVIVMIGVAVAIAAPRYANTVSRYRAEMTAGRIAADLALAQDRARVTGTQRTVTFTAGSEQYQISNMEGLNGGSTYVVDVSDSPFTADIVSADFSGSDEVTFDGYGVPDSGGSVLVQAGDTEKTVTVNADSGKAEVD